MRTGVSQMDQHDVPADSATGERKAFGGVRDRAVGPAGLPFVSSMSSLWSPYSVCLGMRRLIRPYVESPLLAVLGQGSLRTLMISLSLCPATWIYWL